MAGQHPLADLAPRDVVAKAIMREMMAAGTDHMFLDGRGLGAELWEHRFPTILASCREHGIDPVTELIPVVPAAHYASRRRPHGPARPDQRAGAVRVRGDRLHRRARREPAGVKLAARRPRLRRADRRGAGSRPAACQRPVARRRLAVRAAGRACSTRLWSAPLQQLMSASAGVLRSGTGLSGASAGLAELGRQGCDKPDADAWQATNLHLVASALAAAAFAREETRGSHWREDFGAPEEAWRGHLISSLGDAGLSTVFEPVLDEGRLMTGGQSARRRRTAAGTSPFPRSSTAS